jgi:hypothetical protein
VGVGTHLVRDGPPLKAAAGEPGVSALTSAFDQLAGMRKVVRRSDRRYYNPDYAGRDHAAGYDSYDYRPYGRGHDEIRELQRLFPSTNWPYSMRYNDY